MPAAATFSTFSTTFPVTPSRLGSGATGSIALWRGQDHQPEEEIQPLDVPLVSLDGNKARKTVDGYQSSSIIKYYRRCSVRSLRSAQTVGGRITSRKGSSRHPATIHSACSTSESRAAELHRGQAQQRRQTLPRHRIGPAGHQTLAVLHCSCSC